MKRKKAKPTVQIDDGKVKVTRWDFSPGAETGWHRHEMDYVVVPLTDGTLTAEMPDGSVIENKLTVGQATFVQWVLNTTSLTTTMGRIASLKLN